MIVGTPVTVADEEYILRFPIGTLILAEKKLGWKLVSLQNRAKENNLSFEDMSILTKYGLHHPDGIPVSDKEFETILDSISMVEFSELFMQVGYALSGTKAPEKASEKN